MKQKTFTTGIFSFFLLVMICLFPQTAGAGVLDSYENGKIYDVTAYGADSTGKSSSEAGVQAALKAARTDLRKGNMDGRAQAVIYFPKGSYTVSSPIRLYTDMCVAAEAGAKVKCGNDKGIHIYTAQNCSIEGGTWTASGEGNLIHVSNVDNLIIRNVNLQNGNTGITAYYTTGKIENVSVSKCTNEGFCFSNGSQITASKCTVTKNGRGYPKQGYLGHGIAVYGGASLTISDSKSYGNTTGGFSLQNGNLTADNLLIHDNGYVGVGTSKKCRVEMKNCDIYKNGYKIPGNDNGVSLVADSTGKFTGCKFRGNEVTGLLLTGNASASLKNCSFKGNGAHNIYMENLSYPKISCTIDSCTFYKCNHGSVEVHVKKKNAYSLKIKGKNKYYVKPNYLYWLNDKIVEQK